MILKDQSIRKKKRVNPAHLRLAGFVLAGIALIFAGISMISAFNTPTPSSKKSLYNCDAETVVGKKFVTNGVEFEGGALQSDDFSRSGKYSIKLDGDKFKYGLAFEIEDVVPRERYRFSVWRKRAGSFPGILVVTGGVGSSFYKQTEEIVEKDENGWEKLQIDVTIPNTGVIKRLKTYVYAHIPGIIYFDDLSIDRSVPGLSDSFDEVNLYLPQKSILKLKNKRQQAFKEGLLVTGEDDWAKGKILTEEKEIPFEIRLKGDWLDHLNSDKWSYRVKVKGFHAWNRLKTFSLQNPSTRNFLSEWFLHKWFDKEDVLSPRYDFVNLLINNQSKGIYAFEEHFEKQLPEFKLRREGPIVRFTEEGMWAGRRRMMKNMGNISSNGGIDAYQSSDISPFKQSKVLDSPTLQKQFEIAQNLMLEYKFGKKTPKEIFNLDLLAKYYVIMDIMKSHHGIVWHNQRFYYNPVTSKLEPIGYDGFGGKSESWVRKTFFGKMMSNKKIKDYTVYSSLFTDRAFMEKYILYLSLFTKKDYLDELWSSLKEGVEFRQSNLQTEDNTYYFEYSKIKKNARLIQTEIFPYNDVSVTVKKQGKKNNKVLLKVTNNHILPLLVVGTGVGIDGITEELETEIWLPTPIKGQPAEYTDIETSESANYLYYKLPGLSELYYSKISPFKVPELSTPAQELFANLELKSNSLYDVTGDIISFRTGKHTVDKDILIPEGYRVTFEQGTELDFIKKAKFISRSVVNIFGAAEAPVKIYSSDKSANGFTVLQALEESILRYAIFEDFNTLNFKGWVLTGAVTFYESEVKIMNCLFTKNHCEDALNIVRSKFLVESSVVSETYSDGFDADFCTGEIKDSYFHKTGNDGIDFSTSKIRIENCRMETIGDKGISVGEEADVFIVSAEINGANIGVASKDFSKLHIESIDLKNCQQGFAAYQKKPEYGPAEIFVKKYSAENVKFLERIETGSKLTLGTKD